MAVDIVLPETVSTVSRMVSCYICGRGYNATRDGDNHFTYGYNHHISTLLATFIAISNQTGG